jgi:FkbH-like protein
MPRISRYVKAKRVNVAVEPVRTSQESERLVAAGADKAPWQAVGKAILAQRDEIAVALMNSVADWPKYQPAIAADRQTFLKLEIHAFVDYLARYFATGDENFRHLYVGEKLKQAYETGATEAAAQARKELITARDSQGMATVLRGKLAEPELLLFQTVMADIARVVTTVCKDTVKVLMVGDCLHLDVMGFLASASLADGIGIQPTFVTDKTAIQVHRAIKEAATGTFDLVLYSPFTYAFSLAYSQVLDSKFAMKSRSAIEAVVQETWNDVQGTLDLLADRFECPIIVHNSSNILRHGDSVRERLKHGVTAHARQTARTLVNDRLANYITKKNADTFEHFLVLDEMKLVEQLGEFELGRYFYHSKLQHPAMMGKAVAEVYRDMIFVQKKLLTKKLIVCDLDNTLWAGVIGEGAVTHHLDRQQALQRLRKKGVVLAVNSKNDPKNIKWDGGALAEADFVNMQINWNPKVSNFKRIKEALNLGFKDYVFLDDRSDERAMAKSAHPEMAVLDPEVPRTWKIVDVWERMLPSQGDVDRTAFYKSRETRNQFLEEKGLSEEDVSAAFEALDIRVTIRAAEKGDLKRAAELVNRTNQFNLQGSRTTLKEVQAWHDSGTWKILLVDAADKFGSMGTVSVLICQQLEDRVEIPIFVLSCRVFGYGIEDALLNHVKKLAAGKQVVGLFQETPSNAPCRETYRKNGFTSEDGGKRWLFQGEPGANPPWLTVKVE